MHEYLELRGPTSPLPLPLSRKSKTEDETHHDKGLPFSERSPALLQRYFGLSLALLALKPKALPNIREERPWSRSTEQGFRKREGGKGRCPPPLFPLPRPIHSRGNA